MKTLVEQLAERLRTEIIEGKLAPGTHLRQTALARRFGVSLIPVREAIRKLESEGFVQDHPFKGAVIAPLSEADVVDGVEIMFALQSQALRLAFPSLTPEKLARAAALAGTDYHFEEVAVYGGRRLAIYELLFDAQRRPVLWEAIRRHYVANLRYTGIFVKGIAEQPDVARRWRFYPVLVELLQEGDLEGAIALSRERLDQYRDFVVAKLKQLNDATRESASRPRVRRRPRAIV